MKKVDVASRSGGVQPAGTATNKKRLLDERIMALEKEMKENRARRLSEPSEITRMRKPSADKTSLSVAMYKKELEEVAGGPTTHVHKKQERASSRHQRARSGSRGKEGLVSEKTKLQQKQKQQPATHTSVFSVETQEYRNATRRPEARKSSLSPRRRYNERTHTSPISRASLVEEPLYRSTHVADEIVGPLDRSRTSTHASVLPSSAIKSTPWPSQWPRTTGGIFDANNNSGYTRSQRLLSLEQPYTAGSPPTFTPQVRYGDGGGGGGGLSTSQPFASSSWRTQNGSSPNRFTATNQIHSFRFSVDGSEDVAPRGSWNKGDGTSDRHSALYSEGNAYNSGWRKRQHPTEPLVAARNVNTLPRKEVARDDKPSAIQATSGAIDTLFNDFNFVTLERNDLFHGNKPSNVNATAETVVEGLFAPDIPRSR